MSVDFLRALSIVLPLCVLSLLLAGVVVSIANDMYAFVKPDREVTLRIAEGSDINEISMLLGDSGLLNNPDVFVAYVKKKDKVALVEGFYGEITLNSSMSYREILLSLI